MEVEITFLLKRLKKGKHTIKFIKSGLKMKFNKKDKKTWKNAKWGLK